MPRKLALEVCVFCLFAELVTGLPMLERADERLCVSQQHFSQNSSG